LELVPDVAGEFARIRPTELVVDARQSGVTHAPAHAVLPFGGGRNDERNGAAPFRVVVVAVPRIGQRGLCAATDAVRRSVGQMRIVIPAISTISISTIAIAAVTAAAVAVSAVTVSAGTVLISAMWAVPIVTATVSFMGWCVGGCHEDNGQRSNRRKNSALHLEISFI